MPQVFQEIYIQGQNKNLHLHRFLYPFSLEQALALFFPQAQKDEIAQAYYFFLSDILHIF